MFKQRGAGLRCGCWHLILPEMLESVWSHVGISHGMRDVFMSEVMLNRSRVLPRVRQLEAGRVPKHVWVDRKRNSCCSPRPSHDLAECRVSKRAFALAGRHVRRLSINSTEPPQRPYFWSVQWVCAWYSRLRRSALRGLRGGFPELSRKRVSERPAPPSLEG